MQKLTNWEHIDKVEMHLGILSLLPKLLQIQVTVHVLTVLLDKIIFRPETPNQVKEREIDDIVRHLKSNVLKEQKP